GLMLKHAELVHFRTPTVTPRPFDFSGHWVNELGSYMDLKIDGPVVKGRYVSMVTDDGPGPTPPFDIYGSVSGDLINFNVNWGEEITSWIGHGVIYAGGRPSILTLWQIVHTIKDEKDPENQWKTVTAGADEFHR
ncbi:MAG: avidin/streptavidin family protein, partial [Terracidiphilus sp.]